ncbi:testis-specific serine/threonine-protein kinase 6-like [Cimex lectularius]|uniref:Protein kinase domain-containing protein n=1 Tax=Cimex lectularius TaxID=79782 RepID=A0A8I6S334_CIMLE|nr:testis-specific serine/threonine-protein kinase 6-like [Cimex lectularius]
MSTSTSNKGRAENTGGITNSDEKLLKEKGYYFIRQLGEGSYAKVYLANQIRHDKNDLTLACKVINTKRAPKEFVAKFLPRELDILGKVLHPNIVHIHAIYSRSSKYLIFMRYAEVGDLLDYVLEKGELGENISKVWSYQLALAIQYLHTMQVAHRDIKCENILITNNFNVKLADFGFARFVVDHSGKPVTSNTYCGSLAYASPEVLKGKPYYPKCCDVWSLGIVIYIMLNKSMPFNDGNIKVLYKQQVQRQWKFRNRILPTLSGSAVQIVNKLLEPDFRKRLTIGQVVKEPWFDDHGLEMTEEEREALEAATKAQPPSGKYTFEEKEKELVLMSKDREPYQSLTKTKESGHASSAATSSGRESTPRNMIQRQTEDETLRTMDDRKY